jgi:PIN domain nuclease of toxin-antitoxin system
MTLLLDTHALIWFLENNPSLSSKAKALIEDSNNEVFVSIVSFYEIAIKLSIGKIILPDSLEDFILKTTNNDIQILNLLPSHIIKYQEIPLNAEHKDPFDKILIASAIVEKLTIVTIDEKFSLYKPLISLFW